MFVQCSVHRAVTARLLLAHADFAKFAAYLEQAGAVDEQAPHFPAWPRLRSR